MAKEKKIARMDVREVPIEQVHINTWNPNRMSENQKATLARNMEKYDYRSLVIVREDEERGGFEIVDGEHRYRELMQQGVTDLQVCVQKLSKADAMISTLAMNNVHGNVDAVPMALMIKDMMDEGVSLKEISELTEHSERELMGYLDDTAPVDEDDLDPVGDELPPVEISIMLLDGVGKLWGASVERAMKIMRSSQGVPLIGEQITAWEEAMERGHALSGSKSRSVVLEFILRAFMDLPEATAMKSFPTIPLEELDVSHGMASAPVKGKRKSKKKDAEAPMYGKGKSPDDDFLADLFS